MISKDQFVDFVENENIYLTFIRDTKNLISIEFSRAILKKMDANRNDKLLLLRPIKFIDRITLVKSINGSVAKKNIRNGFFEISLYTNIEINKELIHSSCTYFLNKNNTITIFL